MIYFLTVAANVLACAALLQRWRQVDRTLDEARAALATAKQIEADARVILTAEIVYLTNGGTRGPQSRSATASR